MAAKSRNASIVVGIIIVLVIVAYIMWSDIINAMMPADSRPGKITYTVESITTEQFDSIADQLAGRFDDDFPCIEPMREAGILAYEGPKTCLQCHKTITVTDAATGEEKTVDLMDTGPASPRYPFPTRRTNDTMISPLLWRHG